MENSKVSPQEIYEVLEEQKKLLEIKAKLTGMLNKVNQTINSLAVENLQLSQAIELSDNEEPTEAPQQAEIPDVKPYTYNQVEQSALINQQIIEIGLPCYNNEEIDSDEDLHQL